LFLSSCGEDRDRDRIERKSHEDELAPLREKVTDGPLTLIFSAKDEQFNNAVALKEYLESH